MTATERPDCTAECEALLAAAKPGDTVHLLPDGESCTLTRTLVIPPGVRVIVGRIQPLSIGQP